MSHKSLAYPDLFPSQSVMSTHSDDLDKKLDTIEIEHAPTAVTSSSNAPKDAALEILGEENTPLHISPEEDGKVLRKIDLWLMPVLMIVYFLQQLDKCVIPSRLSFLIKSTGFRQVIFILYLCVRDC